MPAVLPYSNPRRTRQNPAKRGGKGRVGAGQGPRCCWCGKRLTGGHVTTCGPVCRSSLSRCKHRTAIGALTDVGMPRHVAERLIAAVGLPQVEIKLNALGWSWSAQERAWGRAEPLRRAA
jgi:hypothetical protein